MARQRSPNRERAYRLWLDSGKTRALKDIAADLGVSDVQVRKWKNLDNWDGKGKGTLPKKQKGNVPIGKKPRGAPKGNKNGVGHGAPEGNKNNFRHGLYEEIYFDNLTEEEKRMIGAMRLDEEEDLLIEQIQLISVRERRLMKRISDAHVAKGGLALDSVINRKLEIDGLFLPGSHEGGIQKQTETTTRTISTFEVIQRLEAELTRVQGRKTKCIESLNKLRMERRKMDEGSKGNAVADDWIAALVGDVDG